MSFTGVITKWTTTPSGERGGLIHIDGESPDYTIPFKYSDINRNYHQHAAKRNLDKLPLTIKCQIQNIQGERHAKSIKINPNDHPKSRGIGIVKMVATRSVMGILYWPQNPHDMVLRFEYKKQAMDCTFDQFVQFEIE